MCKELGVEDYEQWFEDCPERVFNAWSAAYDHQPFGDEQLLLARLCSLMFLQVHSKFGERTWDVMESLTSCFMPASWIGRKTGQSIEIDTESIKQAQEKLSKWQHQ